MTTFNPAGAISSVAGGCGNVMNYTYDSSGRIQGVGIALADGSNSYAYTWTGNRITEVVFSLGVRPVCNLADAYSGASGNYLKTVKQFENTAPSGAAAVCSVDPVSAVRYSYYSDGRLQHVIGPEQYRQMKANPSGPDPETDDVELLKPYASAEYVYSGGRVFRMNKNGRAFTYDATYAGHSPAAPSLNAWTLRTSTPNNSFC